MKFFIFYFTTLFLTSSCGSFISGLQDDMAREDGIGKHSKSRNRFSRLSKKRRKRLSKRGKSYSRPYLVDGDQRLPDIKRKYNSNYRKRYTADDLTDRGGDGSLWTEEGQDNFFFAKNKAIHNGDIIIIKVQKALKDKIAKELARDIGKKKKRKGKKKKGARTPAPAAPAQTAQGKDTSPNKVYDNISGIVIEEISNGLILVRGRKDLMFRREMRSVEVQALMARRDISDKDTINSEQIIETNITVIR